MLKKIFMSLIVLMTGAGLFAADPAADAFLAKARTQLENKKFKKCVSVCNKALESFPQLSEAYYLKGQAYEGWGKPLDAANEYRAALVAQKEHAGAKEGLARVSTQLGASIQ